MASGRGIRAGKAFIELSIDSTEIRRGIARVRRQMSSLGRSLTGIGVASSALGAALTVPLVSAINAAGSYEETLSRFEVVYENLADGQKQWLDAFADQVGRGRSDLLGFAADFQSLLVPIGIDPKAAAEMSRQLTQLTVDLSSFRNVRTGDVARDIQAAFSGSTETLRKYSVRLTQAAIEQEKLNSAIDPSLPKAVADAQAIYNILLRQTQAAQGDAARTADSYANQVERLRGNINDLRIAIGQEFLPIANAFVSTVNRFIEPLKELDAQTKGAIAAVALVGPALLGVGAAAGTLGFALTGLASLIGTVVAAFGTAGIAAGALVTILTSPITGGLLVALTGITVAALKLPGPLRDLVDSTDDVKASFADFFELLGDSRTAGSAFQVFAIDMEIALIKLKNSLISTSIGVRSLFGIFNEEIRNAIDRDIGEMIGSALSIRELQRRRRRLIDDARERRDAPKDPAADDAKEAAVDLESAGETLNKAYRGVRDVLGAFGSGFKNFEIDASRVARAATQNFKDAIENFEPEAELDVALPFGLGAGRQANAQITRAFDEGIKTEEQLLKENNKIAEKQAELLKEVRDVTRRGWDSLKGLVFGGG